MPSRPGPAEGQNSAVGGRARLSIGAKLTLRYTAAVSVTLTAVAVFVYAQVAHRINREARLLLEVQAQELAAGFAAQVTESSFEEAVSWMTTRMERSVRSADPGLKLGIELVSEQGERILGAGSLRVAAPPVSQAVLDGRRPRLLRAINLGEALPYLSMAVRVPGGAVQVAINTERYASNVRHIRDVFLWSLPLVLVVTALIGWLLARGSLRPISQIAETARRIGGGNLAETVPESGSGDELDRLAATLNEMLGRIHDSLSHMRRFNANAAHQLRTPLTAISSEIEVTLEKTRGDEEYRHVLEDVLARVGSLARGVDAMLRLARVEAGLEPGTRVSVSLREVLETVREFFEPVAEEGGVALESRGVPDARVTGDASWLHELFSNLVANALHYTPAGGTVSLTGRLERDLVVIEVHDTGPGIPADQLARIFERFERAGPSGPGSGFGLGLPVAQEIARAHGGHIDVASEPGKGTTLSVRLPRRLPEEPGA